METVRHQGLGRQSKMHVYANGYGVLNRVPPSSFDNTHKIQARDIPLSTYFASLDDLRAIMERMVILVSRILVDHVPFFKRFSKEVNRHIEHTYSKESALKSELVCMGV